MDAYGPILLLFFQGLSEVELTKKVAGMKDQRNIDREWKEHRLLDDKREEVWMKNWVTNNFHLNRIQNILGGEGWQIHMWEQFS